jgi:hypothetical protein
MREGLVVLAVPLLTETRPMTLQDARFALTLVAQLPAGLRRDAASPRSTPLGGPYTPPLSERLASCLKSSRPGTHRCSRSRRSSTL